MSNTGLPRFHYRLGANQPATSPTARRLAEMAEAILKDTGGEFRLDVFPESRLGPDPQMFADVQAGKLDFYLAGATLGGIAPSSALPLMPFTFQDNAAVFDALEGALGDVIRAELAHAGLHAFRHNWLNGFHHITTSDRPIATADDFRGLKIRSPGGAIAADFFKALGAEAGMVPFSGMYDALKARTFDGQSDPHQVAVALRLYEVQSYLSLTGHWWSGFTLLAHGAAWRKLPADIQGVVERGAEAAARAQRADVAAINEAGEGTLAAHGMQVNQADSAGIRARLGEFYARWQAKFDPAAWSLLPDRT
ncbi:MAG TPA: TRAP transporter substrate-binding protein [Stellaceae bacterium]|jgi:tripartite ATP-independent transporter DctP family solute receptor|nr:TRAP transporter substrate-binding protein [Stellaceae bacterium]